MSDATPAYRGYRLQTLYILDRILSTDGSEGLIFQPEGAEDLAIRDGERRLVEVSQVKAYSSDLILSLLSPSKADSFLYRANDLLLAHSDIQIDVVSFGRVGSELEQAASNDGIERQAVVKKISSYGLLSELEATKLFERLRFVSVSEQNIRARIFSTIEDLSLGIDPEPAFDMLNFWLYLCAEKKQEISQSDITQKINNIGRFIAERAAHHSEWFRSVIPIEDGRTDAQSRQKLSEEFHRGISARYEHILADVDEPRPSKIAEIHQGFEKSQVVIVHGASGQGKTTIAYRYLYTFFPGQWRFQILLVENRQQAAGIAAALSGHARAISIPIVVYMDVAPSDIGWEELAKQLSSHRNIQILITVREEDFRRANISGAEIQFTEVDLQFDESEAEGIYQSLSVTEMPDKFLDFKDAWNRFGNSGPLMEFVYLITQGDSLRQRLQQQVQRIQDEVRSGKCSPEELILLRLVSVASAFEARLKLREVVQHLHIASPQQTLKLLEKEYLLRRNEDGTLVGGLHPVRSAILTDILIDPAFSPWSESASICLPFIFEPDIGSFLLYAFSRHSADVEPLLSALSSEQPTAWTAIAGVLRALLWLGVREYAEANRHIIQDIDERLNQAWTIFLDLDIADAMPGVTDEAQSALMPILSPERRAWVRDLRSRQTDKANAFIPVSRWLASLVNEPDLPASELDWLGIGEVLFWIGQLNITLPVSKWLEQVDLNAAVEFLPLETLADLSVGIFYSSPEVYDSWMNINRTVILARFREETQSLAWENDGKNLRTHFFIKLFQAEEDIPVTQNKPGSGKDKFFRAAMIRLRLLRRLFPNYRCYGSRGYGHQVWINAELNDDTQKDIPVRNLPLQSLTRVNSVFRVLGERSLRPADWGVYAQDVMKLRRQVEKTLRQLNCKLEIYFRKEKVDKSLGQYACSNKWKYVRQLIETSPRLPRCAFDEWGFSSDGNSRESESNQNMLDSRQNLAFEKYREYAKAFNEYVRTCSNFFNQAEKVLIIGPELKGDNSNKAIEIAQRAGIDLSSQARLSILNLGDAWLVIPQLQSEFRKILAQFIEATELAEIERLETDTFSSIWKTWYFFASYPTRCFSEAKQKPDILFKKKVKEIKKSIEQEFKKTTSDAVKIDIFSEDIRWNIDSTLWIQINGDSAIGVYTSIETTIDALKKAVDSVYANDLRRYAIKFTWTSIAILLLVKGKPLRAEAIRFSSDLIAVDPGYKMKWWNLIPVEIPEHSFNYLSLEPWKHPRLAMAEDLKSSIFQLSTIASHIKDFERLPNVDDVGKELLRSYMDEITLLLGKAFQSSLDAMSKLLSRLKFLSEKESDSHYIGLITEMLWRTHEQILPLTYSSESEIITSSMSIEEIGEWSERLSLAQESAVAVYLYWIDNTTTLKVD